MNANENFSGAVYDGLVALGWMPHAIKTIAATAHPTWARHPLVRSDRYGCFNRSEFAQAHAMTKDGPPIYLPAFGQPACQFTKTTLGQVDPRCVGCIHKEVPKGDEHAEVN